MKRLLVSLLVLAFAWHGQAAADGRTLVVVASQHSLLESITPDELRRVYLLLPVEVAGIRPAPLRNGSDDFLNQVFLQRVIFMSERGYERQLVSRVFRFGGARPPVFESLPRLADALKKNPEAISVAWRSDDLADLGLKVIGVVWEASSP